ncbi:hypothetical protein BBJ28_00008355 [Nothophytophthora sp. Chile5]|nr:hypothetical protein BBJ28_00008355 [Nothophytophthora sp. Chile5]
MGPQLLVETLQSQCELLSFLPHPAILRGLCSWDFGMRGLSVMHFARLATPERWELTQRYDMTDFSPKNKLLMLALPATIDDLIEALDGLAYVVDNFCQSDVVEILRTARAFMTQLRVTTGPPDAMVLFELAPG